MKGIRINIAIVEPSPIVFEGLANLLHKAKQFFIIFKPGNIDELHQLLQNETVNLIIINPALYQNRVADLVKIQRQNLNLFWIGLIYSIFDQELIQKMNELIYITDSAEAILEKINKHADNLDEKTKQEALTEREIEVLVKMVNGLSNKEIADSLNISIHTVMSHRKNIIEKTSIKSLSGLTIYAISKKFIQME